MFPPVIEIETPGCARGIAEVRGALVNGGLAGQTDKTRAAVAHKGVLGVWKKKVLFKNDPLGS